MPNCVKNQLGILYRFHLKIGTASDYNLLYSHLKQYNDENKNL